MQMTEDQIRRYSRHILLKDVGGVGQQKLLDSSVLVVGAGGLGSPVSLYLAAAGVGRIGLVDADTVELSNLQRQIAHWTDDLDRPKVESAARKLEQLNPDVEVVVHRQRLDAENALTLIRDYDVVVEGTDNFPTKFLVNDACVFAGKPFSQGGILRFQGQTMTHLPGSACYRCAYPYPPPKGAVPTCSEAGVLGAIAGMLGTMQAAEVLKVLLDLGSPLANRLLFFDARTMEFRTVSLKRNPRCPVCGEEPEITELHEYEQPACEIPIGRR
jgi:adenylyltransferase/sulfurtransferase